MKVTGSREDIDQNCKGCGYLLTHGSNLIAESIFMGLLVGFLLGILLV